MDKIEIKAVNFSFFYGDFQALHNINMDAPKNKVVGIIGPSGCGKSTFLRSINRMNEVLGHTRIEGSISFKGKSIYGEDTDAVKLRRDIGMVFQKSNPFPKTIFENVAYGLKINGEKNKGRIAQKVERSLKDAALWNEVKDRLNTSAFDLSGGQQQRLCIARALAVEPKVILMDEPASALDPTATAKIEELILKLKEKYTILIVTHNMQQAARISDFTAFFMLGKLVEYGETKRIFTAPAQKITEDYITGRFG